MQTNGQPGAHTVVTFGELMLRLSPPGYRRLVQAEEFRATFGGAEANVAVSLARLGLNSRFVTRLPAHEVGEAALAYLRRYGVETGHIVRGGDRLGLYYLEAGAGLRGSKVIYDRAGSSLAQLTPGEIDWEAALGGAHWFHWSGITPALGAGPLEALEAALEAARRRGITVSCDVNYRSKLWSREAAQATLRPLMEAVDVLIVGRHDAREVLGFDGGAAPEGDGEDDLERYRHEAVALREAFDLEAVAITLRDGITASHHEYSAMLCRAGDCETPVHSRRYTIDPIVDRVGGGDAFAAGLVYGLLTMPSGQEALEFAVAAACLKHTFEGDANLARPDEVARLAEAGRRSARTDR